MSYLKKYSGGAVKTAQTDPIPGRDQVENSAGGFVWKVDEFIQLRRFLVLGSCGGSYYASEHDLTKENIDGVHAAIKKDGVRVVKELTEISQAGRAPKQGPTLFTLALCIASADLATRQAAAAAVPKICRTTTMLFEFIGYARANRGFGRILRDAVKSWYEDQEADQLALQVVKYRNREGYTHRDMLRLSHPVFPSAAHSGIYNFACKGIVDERSPRILTGFMEAQASESPQHTIAIIQEYNLPRECVKPEHLNEPKVWDALLRAGHGMPLTAMIRNLGKMSNVGLLKPGGAAARFVADRLVDGDQLRRSRVHPISLLAAMLTYQQGHGEKGKLTWVAVPNIVNALDEAFYLAFGNVTPTNKNLLLAIDISGSMDGGVVSGIPGLTPRVAAAAMALVTASVEPNVEIVGFTSTGFGGGPSMHSGYPSALTVLNISKRRRLDDVVNAMKRLHMGGTDCALPWLYAAAEKKDIDACITYTDSETWAGGVHPTQALREYRRKASKPDARSVVMAFVANKFSIADPNDPLQMDVVGMDTATPEILSSFIRGDI